MPVLSQTFSGVVVVSSGSRMTNAGPCEAPENECFWPVSSFVAPAKDEYSPPDREVGMQTIGTFDGLILSRFRGLVGQRVSSSACVETSFANA